MKALNKRINKRKATKITLKTHRKDTHPHVSDERRATESGAAVRPEAIRMHQHY